MSFLDDLKNFFMNQSKNTNSEQTQQTNLSTNDELSIQETSSFQNQSSISLSNRQLIEDNIIVDSSSIDQDIVFLCPVHQAKIFCHSDIIDKLGELTKFIIVSLFTGHSIEEITELTNMGCTTIEEEIEYLINGGLAVKENNILSLTELGKCYGQLLIAFKQLSDGIPVVYNTFANRFEEDNYDDFPSSIENGIVLQNNFFAPLSRDDDFKNSKKIAIKHIFSNCNTNLQLFTKN